jgi:[citrate (pro-3S)-lyase] ligase
MFLKTVLKKLRNKLLIKVLEKQDELSAKTEDATRLTLTRLSEVQSSLETTATVKTTILTDATLSKLSELRTSMKEDLTNITSAKQAEVHSSLKQALAKLTALQSSIEKVDAEKTLGSIAKTQAAIQASIEKVDTLVVNKQDVAELKTEIKMLLTANVEQPPPVSLKAEKGLRNYLQLLKGLSKRYMILITVRDTTGAFLTDDIAIGIKALGFTVDLSFEKGLKKQHHHTYIGVIDRGQVICETLSKQKEPSYYTATRDGVLYEVASKSYPEGNTAIIKIDGVDYATNRRGLNIVVFDPIVKIVIDSVCFDTYAPTFSCSRLEGIVDGLQRKMIALSSGGYTVPQYCIDNKIASVIIYTENEYWNIAENICLSFSLNRKVNIRTFCATRPFRRTPVDDDELFTSSSFVTINNVKLSADDTILVIHPNPPTDVIKRFESSGARAILLTQMAVDMHMYSLAGVRALLDYSVKHPDVKIVCYRMPAFPTKDLSANEQEVKEKGITQNKILEALKKGELITHVFDGLHYTSEELIELFTVGERVYNPNGEFVFKDKASRLVNYVNGRRVTTDQPTERKRSIFALGRCYGVGVFAPDNKTIWSYMQRRFNKDAPELGIAMENYTVHRRGNWNGALRKLSYIPTKPNDIVLIDIWAPEYFPSIDLRGLFQRPHNYGEVWIDPVSHFNERGFCAVADALFNSLQEHKFFEDKLPPPPDGSVPVITPPPMFGIPQDSVAANTPIRPQTAYATELADYKALLKQTRENTIGRIGAVVMNCNPFTLGHRWLIEYAARQVKHLYIFAVEEDKSIFPFADRFELIKQGVADIPNTTVLPSGKFIISSITFTEYFSKSEIQDKVIDPTEDVRLFAEEIAPVLGITVRFAGEEPLDKVTKQYNDAMRRILPEYGVAFEEIPRKETGGAVVSASRVRALLETAPFAEVAEQLAQLVPATTLAYLEKRAAQPTI